MIHENDQRVLVRNIRLEHRLTQRQRRQAAEAILLRLWGRTSLRTDEISPVGDASVLDAWLARRDEGRRN